MLHSLAQFLNLGFSYFIFKRRRRQKNLRKGFHVGGVTNQAVIVLHISKERILIVLCTLADLLKPGLGPLAVYLH